MHSEVNISLRERIMKTLKERRERILNGNINCIPFPFKRFREDLPGVEQGCYYLISGSTKSGKTQITNYLFVFNTIMYCYYNPGKVNPKILYFPLEETAEVITLRFMSFVLNHLTKGKTRISPTDLRSTNENKPLPEEVLQFMDSDKFIEIMNLYESVVTFYPDSNPTGIMKIVRNYMQSAGTVHYKDSQVKDDFGNLMTVKAHDYYVPNDPNEYVMVIVDHCSLLTTEGGMDLRETIAKLSKYMVDLRNKYRCIPVIVQQQSTETNNLEAFKQNKIRPTVAGLSDSKYPARDCNVMLGITNPFAFELPNYLGYDITKLRGRARFLEVVINRNGIANTICSLLFDGAICSFKELPLPNTSEIAELYREINSPLSMIMMMLNNKKVPEKLSKFKFINYLCKLFKKNGEHCNYSR